MRTIQLLILLALGVATTIANAEPWLASRYAQNCAACHSPGRVNIRASERRCTLSCQGCHTNPNGGGLRNFYGKWNEQRWLHSFFSSEYRLNKPRPAVTDQQYYNEKSIKNFTTNPKEANTLAKIDKEGFKLVETSVRLPESEYDRRSTGEKVFVEDLKDAQRRIPHDDPWRERREIPYNAGLDFRYFYLDTLTDGQHKTGLMPMATDVALSVEPIHRLNLVWEGRFLNDPRTDSNWDAGYTSGSQIRSAYAMVDDLPYNSYVMYGLYRPMFGQYNPDHTTLFARSTGLDQKAVYKTLSVGTAPNVPFLNFHLIQPIENQEMAQDRGYAFNLGARFVTLGAYFTFSWWDTTVKDWTLNLLTHRRMSSLTGGFTKGRFTFVGDVTKITREEDTVSSDTGTVLTIEPRFRIWREFYLKASWEYLNTAPDLKLGHSQQVAVGFNMFTLAGIEFETMYKKLNYAELGVDNSEQDVWAQVHFFF